MLPDGGRRVLAWASFSYALKTKGSASYCGFAPIISKPRSGASEPPNTRQRMALKQLVGSLNKNRQNKRIAVAKKKQTIRTFPSSVCPSALPLQAFPTKRTLARPPVQGGKGLLKVGHPHGAKSLPYNKQPKERKGREVVVQAEPSTSAASRKWRSRKK